MPLGPMKGLEFAHTAILETTAQIEEAALEAASPEVVAPLAERVAFLARFVHVHVTGEEQAMYPPLADKVPHIDATFLVDHRDEEQIYADLEGLVGRCARSGSGADLRALKRQVSALRALSDSHIKKENEIVLPLIGDRFDIAEQAAMMSGILAVVPQADMPRYVPWIVACQAPEQAVAYVNILKQNAPPPVFQAARGWIQAGVSPERWGLLTSRIPELA